MSGGIPAPVAWLPATSLGSEASLTACETTSQGSIIQFNRSKILSFERTTVADDKQTHPRNKIIHPSNKMIFPINSLTTFFGKTMPSYD